ncbi:MAG: methyltransferase [Myxococcota bacterium]
MSDDATSRISPNPDTLNAQPSREQLEAQLGAFGAHLELRRPPLTPEFELFLLSDGVDLEASCQELADGEAPPFWAFCWGGGQALARFILDHPESVRDQRVLDLGTGSGIVALAAARAGASEVIAADLDPVSRQAAELNASRNELSIQTVSQLPNDWDLMLAADVLYETGLRDWILSEAVLKAPILLADPQRTGTPKLDVPILETFNAITFPDVDSPQKHAVIHAIPQRNPR